MNTRTHPIDPVELANLDLDAIVANAPTGDDGRAKRPTPTAPGWLQNQVGRTLRMPRPTPDPAAGTPSEPAPPTAVGFLRAGSPNKAQPCLWIAKYLFSGAVVAWLTRVHRDLWALFTLMLYYTDMGPRAQRVTAKLPELARTTGIPRDRLRAMLALLEQGAPAQPTRPGRRATPALPPLFDALPDGTWRWRPAGFDALRRYAQATLSGQPSDEVRAAARTVRARTAAHARWQQSAAAKRRRKHAK